MVTGQKSPPGLTVSAQAWPAFRPVGRSWWSTTEGRRLARCDDRGYRVAEMLAVVRCERHEEMAEFLGRLGVESVGCPAAGVGERHAQRSPVPWHGGPPDEAAPFCSVYQAGERGLLHAETLSQFSHAPGAEGQDAQELGLDGSQIVTFGDARVNALHQAGELDKPVGGVSKRH